MVNEIKIKEKIMSEDSTEYKIKISNGRIVHYE